MQEEAIESEYNMSPISKDSSAFANPIYDLEDSGAGTSVTSGASPPPSEISTSTG